MEVIWSNLWFISWWAVFKKLRELIIISSNLELVPVEIGM